MTVVGDRIEMVGSSNEPTLDSMFKGEWYLHTLPKDNAYHNLLTLGYGDPVDLTATVVGLTLQTDDFPRD